VFILNNFDEILKVRPDLTREDLYDIIDIMDVNNTVLEAVNKFYPLNQGAGDCAA
jgi:hypothetical protein